MAGPRDVRASRRSRVVGPLAVLAVALLVGAVVLVPAKPPGLRHTSVLNVLFDDRWVVGGTRTVALIGALYLVASIVVRVQRDQWLRQVGPADVETDRSISDVTQDQVDLQEALDRAHETIDRLTAEYADLLTARAADHGETPGPATDGPATDGTISRAHGDPGRAGGTGGP